MVVKSLKYILKEHGHSKGNDLYVNQIHLSYRVRLKWKRICAMAVEKFPSRTQRKHLKIPSSPLLIDKCLEKHDKVLSVCPHNAKFAWWRDFLLRCRHRMFAWSRDFKEVASWWSSLRQNMTEHIFHDDRVFFFAEAREETKEIEIKPPWVRVK